MPSSLSPSRASDFLRCPLLYRFRVVDRLPEPVSVAQARGILVHAVLERIFDLPGERRTRDEVDQLLEAAWADLLNERPELAEVVADDQTHRQAWLQDARALVDRWFTLEDPSALEPQEREFYVETEIDGLTLRGYIDRLDRSASGSLRIVDYKTGRAPGEPYDVKALFQLKFYALVLWRLTGQVPSRLQLVYLGSGEVISYDPDADDLRFIARKVAAVREAITLAAQTGEFLPNRGGHCGFCAHQQICPAWGGTAPTLPAQAAALALDPGAAVAVEQAARNQPGADGDGSQRR